MVSYLIKSCLCLIILLLVYHAFLEREKMHRFNRYFLLFSLIFALSIPLLTIELAAPAVSNLQITQQIESFSSSRQEFTPVPLTSEKQVATGNSIDKIEVSYFFISYVLIASILLLRLLYNLFSIISKISNNPRISTPAGTLILSDDCEIPHSFFSYIFLNKGAYRSGTIDEVILRHERAHIKQKHSLDILFVELLKVLFWFNPAIYFFKRAIQLNHEFLADEFVINKSKKVKNYQKLLLNMQSNAKNVPLASSIHYSITKKRIIMMTKKTNRLIKLSKQVALIPLLALLLFAFSTHTVHSQDVNSMSLSELIEATSERLQMADSLSAEERRALNSFITEMRKKLKPTPPVEIENQPPPPPPQEVDNLEPPQPPAPVLDSVAVQLERARKAYDQSIGAYLHIAPLKQNLTQLTNAYQVLKYKLIKLRVLNKKADGLQPPLPPVPINPSERIANQISQEYNKLIDIYLEIKPIQKNRSKMEAVYKKIRLLYEEWNEMMGENYAGRKLPPLPPRPGAMIEAHSDDQ